MNNVVYKFPLPIDPNEGVVMPKGAEVLYADQQGPGVGFFVWALVDPYEGDQETRSIFVVGTGHSMPEGWEAIYINSVQHEPFIWHFFERMV